MTREFRTVFAVVFGCAMLWQMTGCASADRTAAVLGALERGKARGHLILTTSAGVAAGQTTKFFVGANDTTLAFDGNIDFGDVETLERSNVGTLEP